MKPQTPSGEAGFFRGTPAGTGLRRPRPEGVGERLRRAVLDASGASPAPFVGTWRRVTSTNEVAKAVALEAGDARCAGSVLIAESQTEGKGRFGRSWASPPGGLYLSVLVEPPEAAAGGPAGRLALLPLAAGVALARAVRRIAQVPAELRWPNDLDWRRRKVAGVLAEAGFRRDRPHLAVVGFGVNLTPVSLSGCTGERATGGASSRATRPPGSLPGGVDRIELARALVASFRDALEVLREDPVALRGLWESLSPTALGYPCDVRFAQGNASGVTEGLDAGGGLRVRLESGGLQVVTASEAVRVFHSGPRRPAMAAPGFPTT